MCINLLSLNFKGFVYMKLMYNRVNGALKYMGQAVHKEGPAKVRMYMKLLRLWMNLMFVHGFQLVL